MAGQTPKAIAWKAPERISALFPTNAAILTSPNTTIFIADADYEVESVSEVHETLGTDGGAVTLDCVKCTGTQAASAGATVLSSTFNLKATINTVVRKDVSSGTLVGLGSRMLAKGDRLALLFTGTLTALTGVCVEVILKPIKKKPRW